MADGALRMPPSLNKDLSTALERPGRPAFSSLQEAASIAGPNIRCLRGADGGLRGHSEKNDRLAIVGLGAGFGAFALLDGPGLTQFRVLGFLGFRVLGFRV